MCANRDTIRATDFARCIQSDTTKIVLHPTHWFSAFTSDASNDGSDSKEPLPEADSKEAAAEEGGHIAAGVGDAAHRDRAPHSGVQLQPHRRSIGDITTVPAVGVSAGPAEGGKPGEEPGMHASHVSSWAATGQRLAGTATAGEAQRQRHPLKPHKRRREGATPEAGYARAAKKGRPPSTLDGGVSTTVSDQGSPTSTRRVAELRELVQDLQTRLDTESRRLAAEKANLAAEKANLAAEKANRHAAALSSMCSGVDLEQLAAILGRAKCIPNAATLSTAEYELRGTTVFGIDHVRNTAGKVLAASRCTPAGILRSVLLEVANPEAELNPAVLSQVMVYIHQESAHDWSTQQLAHLRAASALAAVLTNESIGAWRKQKGELTLECMQVWPIVRVALATVFKELHGYGVLQLYRRTTSAHCLYCVCAHTHTSIAHDQRRALEVSNACDC